MTTLATEPEATTWTCRSSFCDAVLATESGYGHGYCNACKKRWYRAGRPEEGPPPPVDPRVPKRLGKTQETRERLERFAELRRLDLTIAECAAVMGITESTAGHLNSMLLRQQRERAREDAVQDVVDWPVPTPPREPVEHWTDRAACYGQWELFFAPEGRGAEAAAERESREAKAKSLCARCPVRADCLDRAIAQPEKHGTWGGLGEDERALERRRAQRRGAARKERAA